jgi:hypothetical protein
MKAWHGKSPRRLGCSVAETQLFIGQRWVSTSFRPSLPRSSLTQTTGTETNARITLDTDAAGHGWFIDLRRIPNSFSLIP